MGGRFTVNLPPSQLSDTNQIQAKFSLENGNRPAVSTLRWIAGRVFREVFPSRAQGGRPPPQKEGEFAKQDGVYAEDQGSIETQTRARSE